jgi:DnaJ-class molecular chaperone
MARQRRDPHEVLGVNAQATREQLTAAYRALLHALHPDHGHTSPAEKQRLAEVMAAYKQILRATDQPGHPTGTNGGPGAHGQHADHGGRREPIPLTVRVRASGATEPQLRIGPLRRHLTTGQ